MHQLHGGLEIRDDSARGEREGHPGGSEGLTFMGW